MGNQQESLIEQSVKVLKSGGVILYPTDTIWGIGCNAIDEKAIRRVYEIKKRIIDKSLIILLSNMNQLSKYVKEVPSTAKKLIEETMIPLTIIYEHATNLPEILCAQDGSIAIRVVKNEFCEKLIDKLEYPLVSTSANISGEKPPIDFKDIKQEIKDKVDFIVKLNESGDKQGKASKIIKLNARGDVQIIRE